MLSDLDIAHLCSHIYSQPSFFDKIINVDEVCIGIKTYDDCVAVIARGSYVFLDWVRDLEAVALVSTPDIGLVPMGFNLGIAAAEQVIEQMRIEKPLVLGGHSLGAAHVAQLGGIRLVRGQKPIKTALFGCPSPGGEKLRYIWSGSTLTNYRNMSDPVPLVPVLPSLRPVRDFQQLTVNADKADPWGIFSHHHIGLYCAGVAKLLEISDDGKLST